MMGSFGRWSVTVLVSLAAAAACGGDDGKKQSQSGDAGEAGQAGAGAGPSSGGSENNAGEPAVIEAGTGQGGAPLLPVGGAAGTPVDTGGAPPIAQAGQAGEPSAVAGAGGEPSLSCCTPLTCADLVDADCGYAGVDPCTGMPVECACEQGEECVEGFCETCVPDIYACENDHNLCGETFDNCGNPITCQDTCSEQSSFASCYNGSCCYVSKYYCSSGDCGTVQMGCGQTMDCGNTCEGTDTCQPNGTCCTPSASCGTGVCGMIDDGCGNTLDCGDPCFGTFGCLENECQESVCKANGFDCGLVDNAAVEGDEHCGMCSAGLGCLDNQCVPICLPPE